jgi:hypothetical protein
MTRRRALYWTVLAVFLVMVGMMWLSFVAAWPKSAQTAASGLAGASLAALLLVEGKLRFTPTGKLMLIGGVAVAVLAILSLLTAS